MSQSPDLGASAERENDASPVDQKPSEISPGCLARERLNKKQRKAADDKLRSVMSLYGQRLLTEALDEGGDVNAVYPRGESRAMASPIWGLTVSMLAAQKLGVLSQSAQAFPAMERVLKECDPGARDREGLTPLMHAASEHSLGVEALAERSDLLAVCGDMGADFDAGWPALFFAINLNPHFMPTGGAREQRARAVIQLLAHPKVWEIRSREGLDAIGVAQRLGPNPTMVAFLESLRAAHAAQEQAIEIERAVEAARSPPKKISL